MMARLAGWTLVVALALPVSAARAQSARDLFQQGVRAYRRLEFVTATQLFERALALPADPSDTVASRGRLLEYLAASHLFARHPDSARATVRRLLREEPRHQVDDLVFPPEVSSLFTEVRRFSPIVQITAPADTLLRPPTDGWEVRLVPAAFPNIDVSLTDSEGALYRRLYTGPIADTLLLRWDLSDSLSQRSGPGRYLLKVMSRDPRSNASHLIELPLDLSFEVRDTQPQPPPLGPSDLLPERTPGGGGAAALIAGSSIGLSTVLLPSILASGGSPSNARFVVGGAITMASLGAFLQKRPGRPIRENIAANLQTREAWERRRADVARENAERLADVRVRVRSGTVGVTDVP